jgi:hypothetical protein
VQFEMNQTTSWTGGWVAQIWNITGTPGTNAIPVGSGGNTNPSSVGNTGFPIGSAISSSTVFRGPLTSIAKPVQFNFTTSPIFNPGSYMVSLTDNSTIAPAASSLVGMGIAPNNITVRTMFGDGTPAYIAHNVYLPRTGQLIRNTKAFWFTVTGAEGLPGIRQVPLGTWVNMPTSSSCSVGNSSASICELMGNQSYRGILAFTAAQIEAGLTLGLQVGCITPSNNVGAILFPQYANYSAATHTNSSNFVSVGGGIPIDNSANWPCPGNLDMAANPLPATVQAFIFRIVGVNGGGNGDNPRFSNIIIDLHQTVPRIAVGGESGISTTGFTERMSLTLPPAITTSVSFQWIATNGGLTTQSGSGSCSVTVGNSACTSAVTFSPAFSTTPNVVSSSTTFFGAIQLPIGSISLLSAQTLTV